MAKVSEILTVLAQENHQAQDHIQQLQQTLDQQLANLKQHSIASLSIAENDIRNDTAHFCSQIQQHLDQLNPAMENILAARLEAYRKSVELRLSTEVDRLQEQQQKSQKTMLAQVTRAVRKGKSILVKLIGMAIIMACLLGWMLHKTLTIQDLPHQEIDGRIYMKIQQDSKGKAITFKDQAGHTWVVVQTRAEKTAQP